MVETALIIAAGKGTRLKPVGGATPKPLVRVAGVPLIKRVILTARQAGISRFVIVTGYAADRLRATLDEDPQVSGLIEWVHNEHWEAPNGLSVLAARDRLPGNFVLLMADHIFEAKNLLRLRHYPLESHECVLCIDWKLDTIYDLDDATKVRVEGSHVVAIDKQLTEYDAIDTGMFLCSPALFDALDACRRQDGCSLSAGIQRLARDRRMRACDVGDGYWQDIDTPAMLTHAERMCLRGDVLLSVKSGAGGKTVSSGLPYAKGIIYPLPLQHRQPALSSERENQRHDATVIAKGAGVNFLGTLAKTVKSTSFVLMTRLFGANVFGLSILGWSVIDLVSKLGMFGLDKGVLKFVVQYRSDQNEDGVHRTLGQAVLTGLAVSVVVTGLAYLGAPVIADRVFHKPELTKLLRVLALAIPFLTLSQVLLAATKSLKIMRFDAYVKSLAEPIVMLAAACLCFVIGWRFSGIALAHLVAAIGGAACGVYFFRRVFSLRACMHGMRGMSLWSEVTKFSIPVVGYDVLYILMMRLDTLMLGYFLPAVQVGIYGATIEVALATKKVRQWFEPIFAPIISELHHRREPGRLANNFSLVTRWILTVNIVFFFGILLIGRDILAVFGSEFTIGALSLTLLSLSQVIYGSLGSGDLVLLMAGHPYLNLLNTSLVLVLNAGLGLVLIPRYGMAGAAVGTLVSFGMLSLVRIIEMYVLFRIHPFRQTLLKPVGAGLIAFILTEAVATWCSTKGIWCAVLLAVMFVMTYGVILVRFGLEEEDRLIIRQVCNRFRTYREFYDAKLRLRT